jgi:hypothetical protein
MTRRKHIDKISEPWVHTMALDAEAIAIPASEKSDALKSNALKTPEYTGKHRNRDPRATRPVEGD